jgi:hypothetical protein
MTDTPANDVTSKPVDFRITMIRIGLEAEMIGMRLTSKAPKCFTIIAKEFGIRAKRGPEGKREAYEIFCARFGFTPKPAKQTGAIYSDKNGSSVKP